MNILIIENSLDGHRGIYLNWITRSLLENDHKVIIALPDNMGSHESIAKLTDTSLCYETYDPGQKRKYKTLLKWLGFFAADFEVYLLFRSIYKRLQHDYAIDVVFIPYFDSFLYSTAIFGSAFGTSNFSVLSMRPDFHYAEVGVNVPAKKGLYFKRYLFERLFKIATLSNIMTLDEPLSLYYKNLCNKIVYMPEPAEAVSDFSDKGNSIAGKLGLDPRKKKVLVFGAQTRRKGVVQLLEAMLDKIDDINLQIIFAGKSHDDITKYLEQKKFRKYVEDNSILIINRFITEQEESSIFINSDICWLGYINHYRASGVLIQAAKYGLPVIATNLGIIGWQVARYKLGIALDVMDTAQIQSAFSTMCSPGPDYDTYVTNTKKAFLENTHENAQKILNDVISG